MKIRDGHVANRPIYPALGVSRVGEKDIHGQCWIRAETTGEGATFSAVCAR